MPGPTALPSLAVPLAAMLNADDTMIIACPACATRYVVPDSAIGVDGRTVRCAKCRHSWFQDGPDVAAPLAPQAVAPERAEAAAAVPAPVTIPEPPPVFQPDPTAGPEAPAVEPETTFAEPEPQVAEPEPGEAPAPVADWDRPRPASGTETPAVAPQPEPELPTPTEPPRQPEPEPQPPISLAESSVPAPPPSVAPLPEPEVEDDYSRFAYEPLFRPRRNPARMWTIAAVLFAVVALGAVAATAWFGLPSWMPFAHSLFAEDQPGLTLDFPAKMQGQRPLSDQTWFFEANGTVTNVSQSARSVPTILAVLKDARGRIVFSAELHSPKRVLAPGESVSINEALVSVPKAAVKAEFGWKPGS